MNRYYLNGLLYCDRCEKAGRTFRLIFTGARGKVEELYDYYLCRCRRRPTPGPRVRSVLDDEIGLALTVCQQGNRAHREHLQREIKRLTVKEEQLFDLAVDERDSEART